MLKPGTDIYCGLFDSSILRQNVIKSQDRLVKNFEIELFHQNSGVSHVNSRAFVVQRGMILIAKPGQIRYSDFPVKCSFIRIDPQNADPHITNVLSAMPTCVYLEDNEEIEKLLGKFAKLGSAFISYQGLDSEDLSINAMFFDILYRCKLSADKSLVDKSSAPANQTVRTVYEYINEHFCADCSLSTLAAAVHVSPNYLHVLFKSVVGMTPFEYVMKKRIDMAQRLIMAGEKSMLEISMETGFCSQSHFNKTFKSRTGQTPAQYRQSLIDKY